MASRAADSMDDDKDRISYLPDFIIHQILSYLDSYEEAARTRVLSKRWLQSHSTSPNLTFNQSFHSSSNEIENQKPKVLTTADLDSIQNTLTISFLNSVHKTLLRYQTLNLTIHKLRIILLSLNASTVPLLDKSIRLTFDIGVQDLTISLEERYCITYLPSSMFEHPNVLTSLTVKYFLFPHNVITNAIMFPFLKALYLHRVYINDEMIQTLLSRSPSLEKVILFHVNRLTKFRVSNLGELKTLGIIMGLDRIQSGIEYFEIDIDDAPSLRFLRFSSWSSMCFNSRLFNVPFLLRVGSAPNLKYLKLERVNINDNDLKELMTKFPLLEKLKIVQCDWLEKIDIASISLKHLCLCQCGVEEAKIDAPSLLELKYTSNEDTLLLSVNNRPEEQVSGRSCLLYGSYRPEQLVYMSRLAGYRVEYRS